MVNASEEFATVPSFAVTLTTPVPDLVGILTWICASFQETILEAIADIQVLPPSSEFLNSTFALPEYDVPKPDPLIVSTVPIPADAVVGLIELIEAAKVFLVYLVYLALYTDYMENQ